MIVNADSSTVSAAGPSTTSTSNSTATTGYSQATAVQEHHLLFTQQRVCKFLTNE